MADRLWKKAERDLCMHMADAPPDMFVWDHARRVAKLVEVIAELPSFASESFDADALRVAALYHDIGWVLQVRAGKCRNYEVMLRPTPDFCYELAADFVEAELKELIDVQARKLAADAIRQCRNRDTKLIEARILSDADNLDQIGPQAVPLMVRKQWAEGRTLDSIVTAWIRQEEYHYWQARIKECFRSPSVRQLAHERWQSLRKYMNDLRAVLASEQVAAEKTRLADSNPASISSD